MIITPTTKNQVVLTQPGKTPNVTWDEANYTWDEADGSWDNPTLKTIPKDKNTLSITLKDKND
jgi:hypothetical protein